MSTPDLFVNFIKLIDFGMRTFQSSWYWFALKSPHPENSPYFSELSVRPSDLHVSQVEFQKKDVRFPQGWGVLAPQAGSLENPWGGWLLFGGGGGEVAVFLGEEVPSSQRFEQLALEVPTFLEQWNLRNCASAKTHRWSHFAIVQLLQSHPSGFLLALRLTQLR